MSYGPNDVHPNNKTALWMITILLACLSVSCGGSSSTSATTVTPQSNLTLLVTTIATGFSQGNTGLTMHWVDITIRESNGVTAYLNLIQFGSCTPNELGVAGVENAGGSGTISANSQMAFRIGVYCNVVQEVTADLTDTNGYNHSLTWNP